MGGSPLLGGTVPRPWERALETLPPSRTRPGAGPLAQSHSLAPLHCDGPCPKAGACPKARRIPGAFGQGQTALLRHLRSIYVCGTVAVDSFFTDTATTKRRHRTTPLPLGNGRSPGHVRFPPTQEGP